MSDMKITVIIAGLAYCRLTTRELQVLFLHADQRHKLTYSVSKNGVNSGESVIGEVKDMSIALLEESSGHSAPIRSNHPAPLDMNKHLKQITNIDGLHSIPPFITTLKLIDNPSMALSYLSIPRGEFYTAALSEKVFDVFKLKNGSSRTFLHRRKLGIAIGVDFTIDDDEKAVFKIDNTPHPFPYEEDTKYIITFNNFCPNDTCEDDFRYYYEILDGKGITIMEQKHDLDKESKKITIPDINLEIRDKETACNLVIGNTDCDLRGYFRTGNCD
ncbi:MAG: hypothetical protein WA584_14755 [Pyrinomonadaceae bacterium]